MKTLVAWLSVLAVSLIVALPAQAGAGGSPTPTAQAAGKCGNVKARNGATAKFVYGNKVGCKTARRVARRATGRTYRAYGFTCKVNARLYGCSKPGTSKGIGFSYER